MQELVQDNIWIVIGEQIPSVEDAAGFAGRSDCGAVNIFTGMTRNHEKGRQVQTLYYDCYEEMALNVLSSLAAETCNRHNAGMIVVFHRTGEVPVGECSLVVAVSSPHRKQALDATAELIDRLKEEVPVWKKETFADEVKWKEEQ
ncbi:molybdenum cofactor biosynthesis protein MoaE [Natronogracilivirga saccharolytica]|uniref:Molybdopterin synthase catalytic subunit n=1 Tax=Natronogracilivirga saccharolytica TaxID=2812953 RepID=A0A8J7UVC6_9BACT|nr:molybdenum cofactor biosynthesis protein MoaE [Natronogracilivirga saccharolytica]MBP3193310.1 molybdenum cofactor biosynthesis protein MoaE [Natronogracilivirga saccharolytica]